MIALSLIAVVYIGFVALVQHDMKKLIAYSSIAHMGFVTLGFFVIFEHRCAVTGDTRRRARWASRAHGADDVARPDLGRAVPLRRRAVRPHAQPRDQRLRRRHQHDAEVRGAHGAVRARERGPARHVGLRRRVLRDHRQLPRRLLVRVPRGDDVDPRRRLHAVDGQARGVRRGRERATSRRSRTSSAREFWMLDGAGGRGADRRRLAGAARRRDATRRSGSS